MSRISRPIDETDVLAVIMGGGQGKRLFPLTMERAKPAVPLAGKYRLVDVPISNCINSGFRQVYLLTQFNSASLHRHIAGSYKFDHFRKGFVEILAAEQKLEDSTWYQGTADAVRKNLIHFMNQEWKHLLILSGDQLYRMDYRRIVDDHVNSEADITVASIPVHRTAAHGLGILQIAEDRRITRFVEKPTDPAVLDSLKLHPEWYEKLGVKGNGDLLLASMGIYVFSRPIVEKVLDNKLTDFGKHIIPESINNLRVFSHIFQGYWEDIGTIRAFFEANLDLTNELPRFDFFDMADPIFSRPRFLPGSKINGAHIDHAVVSDGCIINYATITHTIVGLRSFVGAGTVLNRVVLMGCDYYESMESIALNAANGAPRMGIGQNCRIENTIVDKNARIGDNVVITPAGKPDNVDVPRKYYIRDGIVIIPKKAIIPNGTVI